MGLGLGIAMESGTYSLVLRVRSRLLGLSRDKGLPSGVGRRPWYTFRRGGEEAGI
jgi:hypothetical protein